MRAKMQHWKSSRTFVWLRANRAAHSPEYGGGRTYSIRLGIGRHRWILTVQLPV